MRFARPRTGRHVPFAFAATALAALAVQWTTEPRRADRPNDRTPEAAAAGSHHDLHRLRAENAGRPVLGSESLPLIVGANDPVLASGQVSHNRVVWTSELERIVVLFEPPAGGDALAGVRREAPPVAVCRRPFPPGGDLDHAIG